MLKVTDMNIFGTMLENALGGNANVFELNTEFAARAGRPTVARPIDLTLETLER